MPGNFSPLSLWLPPIYGIRLAHDSPFPTSALPLPLPPLLAPSTTSAAAVFSAAFAAAAAAALLSLPPSAACLLIEII